LKSYSNLNLKRTLKLISNFSQDIYFMYRMCWSWWEFIWTRGTTHKDKSIKEKIVK